jgi:hypothetical protein
MRASCDGRVEMKVRASVGAENGVRRREDMRKDMVAGKVLLWWEYNSCRRGSREMAEGSGVGYATPIQLLFDSR